MTVDPGASVTDSQQPPRETLVAFSLRQLPSQSQIYGNFTTESAANSLPPSIEQSTHRLIMVNPFYGLAQQRGYAQHVDVV